MAPIIVEKSNEPTTIRIELISKVTYDGDEQSYRSLLQEIMTSISGIDNRIVSYTLPTTAKSPFSFAICNSVETAVDLVTQQNREITIDNIPIPVVFSLAKSSRFNDVIAPAFAALKSLVGERNVIISQDNKKTNLSARDLTRPGP